MDCSPPGSSINGIVQARILEWAAILFLTHGWNLGLLYCRQILLKGLLITGSLLQLGNLNVQQLN